MRKAIKPRGQSDEHVLASAEQQRKIPEEGLKIGESEGQTRPMIVE
jgi:hypothetical protein